MARKKRSPFALPRPPLGTYDPSIDASQRAAQRGYHDLQSDTARQNTRAASDFAIQGDDINRARDYGLADILRQKTRLGEDIDTQGGQIEQGYQRGLADILTNRHAVDRQYVQQGNRQLQSANAAGLLGGGATGQARAKRSANEGIDMAQLDVAQQRLDENHTQAVSALDLTRKRAIEDVGTSRERLTAQFGTGASTYKPGSNPWVDAWMAKNPGKEAPGAGHDMGYEGLHAALGYQRGTEDRATNLQRGGRELNAYGQDLVPTRYYSAAGLTTYTPPKRKRR